MYVTAALSLRALWKKGFTPLHSTWLSRYQEDHPGRRNSLFEALRPENKKQITYPKLGEPWWRVGQRGDLTLVYMGHLLTFSVAPVGWVWGTQ